ncbi:MAG: hypothetical protein V4444_00550 [Pseudomonadota bacterium]
MTTRAVVPLVAAIVMSGCATAPPGAGNEVTLPPGQYGGDQIALDVAADGGGHIELSCASAEFTGPVKLDPGGHFLTAGSYTRGTGVATIQPPPSLPANISGRLDSDGTLWLDIALRDSYPLRSVRLKRGAAPNLMRCL